MKCEHTCDKAFKFIFHFRFQLERKVKHLLGSLSKEVERQQNTVMIQS